MAGARGGWTTDVAAGWRGASDGALTSTRSLNIEGTSRPVAVAGFAVGGATVAAGGGGGATTGVGSVSPAGGSAGEATTAAAGGVAGGASSGGTTAAVGGAARGSSGGATRGSSGGAATGSAVAAVRSSTVASGGVSSGGPVSAGSLGVAAAACGTGAWTSGSSSLPWPSGVTGGTTFGDLIRRGGPRRRCISGSGVFAPFPPLRPRVADGDFCENSGPAGRFTSRSRAVRWTNCLATISSIVLEALLTSMPCSRLSRSMTS